MKRMLLLTLLFLLSAGTASADYVLVKIDLNQLDLFPPELIAALPQGGAMGGNPGAMMGQRVLPCKAAGGGSIGILSSSMPAGVACGGPPLAWAGRSSGRDMAMFDRV